MAECWRLIVHPPAGGAWNMAVDEAILRAVSAGKAPPTLRLYEWDPPAISLGYFQPAADADGCDLAPLPVARAACQTVSRRATKHGLTSNPCHPIAGRRAHDGYDLVRRLTGGGAILHDAELTYSICLPAGHALAASAAALYRGVHEAIVAALKAVGVAAALRGGESDPPSALAAQRGPFFCFARRDANDIVCRTGDGTLAKIAGSAQRRTRRGVLQHGSILTGPPRTRAGRAGSTDVAAQRGRACEASEVIDALIGPLAERLNATPQIDELSADEQTHAERLADAKYAADAWTRRR